jgi:hypothetical protein
VIDFRRAFKPGVPDVVFGVILAIVLAGGHTGFLNDPGTFWHLRLGREIARTRDVPRYDTLTFTRDRAPWVDQSWAFDLGLAAVVDRWGWSAVIAMTALGLATLYGSLARGLLNDGISPAIVLLVSVLAAGIGSIHFLVRPHLFTLAFMLWTLRICQAQHVRGGWAIFRVPLLMIAWANLHGGFLAGPVIVATALLGDAISGPLDPERRRNLFKFAAAFALSLAAPLVNPYGFGLYRHVAHLLVSSGVTELIDEYQPLPFGQAKARVVELVVLALIALPTFARGRLNRYDLLHALVWLHFALGGTRQVPLFALAVAPGLGKLLDGLPVSFEETRKYSMRWSAWPALTALTMGLAVAIGARLGGFDPKTWPLDAVARLDREPVDARLFHEQDWGGMIEAQCRPTRRAYLDDRFELFGKTAILEYLDVLQGGPEWDAVRDRDRIGLVWVRPERGLARRLAADPHWKVVYRDKVSVLFRFVPVGETVSLHGER